MHEYNIDIIQNPMSCPKCHKIATVRPSGTTHFICDPSLTDEDGNSGCNAQFYTLFHQLGEGTSDEIQFEDRYTHFPFNIIFQIAEDGDDDRPGAREQHKFFRKPCIWTVPPLRITDRDINPEEQEACRRGCPDLCERPHCPKNPAKIYCVDPKTMKPTNPPCDSFPDCECVRVVPPTMWQCIWDLERRCPDDPLVIQPLGV